MSTIDKWMSRAVLGLGVACMVLVVCLVGTFILSMWGVVDVF